MDNFRFSVWTATYDRAKFLTRLYASLKKQSFQDFEWIIIDDGSVDDTKSLVQNFQDEGVLRSIKYVYKENGGKHTAWRVATNLFKAPYVITIDSDDTLLPDALYIFNEYWKELENSSEYNLFWEIKGRCLSKDGSLIGQRLPSKIFDSSTDEMAFKYKYKREMHACRKTEVLRKEAKVPDKFPFEKNCNNFSESIRWSRSGRKYKTRYFDLPVRIYYFDADNTLTSKQNISEKALYNSLIQGIFALSERTDVMVKWDLKSYLKTIVLFYSNCFALKEYPLNLVKGKFFNQLFLSLMIVPSFFYWKIFKNKRV